MYFYAIRSRPAEGSDTASRGVSAEGFALGMCCYCLGWFAQRLHAFLSWCTRATYLCCQLDTVRVKKISSHTHALCSQCNVFVGGCNLKRGAARLDLSL